MNDPLSHHSDFDLLTLDIDSNIDPEQLVLLLEFYH